MSSLLIEMITYGINLKTITDIVDEGTGYQSGRCFSWVKGAYFCPKRNQEGKSYYGLEIADFCAYPIKMFFVKNETASEEFTIITPKVYEETPDAFRQIASGILIYCVLNSDYGQGEPGLQRR